jgi:hypothetical protein
MAISNMMHVGSGKHRFILKSGEVVRCDVLHNDRTGEFFGLEIEDGCFAVLPYALIDRAVVSVLARSGAAR